MYNIANKTIDILLTIYSISDVYSILSYGRIKTHIQNQLKFNPYTNPYTNSYLTVLSGDFISPVKYTTIDGGLTVSKIIQFVPIDIVSFGNHEFDITPEKLNQSLKLNDRTNFISTNIANIANTVEYYIYSDKNLTIGFIGLCTQDFYYKFPIEFISDDKVNLTINSIKSLYRLDLIIGLTHAELSEDIEYINKFPQIDLILGGHIHSHGYIKYNKIPIIRTGENADSVYEINIYSDKSIQLNLVDISNLQPASDIYELYLEAEKHFEKFNNEVLFYFENPKSNQSPRTNQESLPQLICSQVTKYFSSDLTILNSGMFKLRDKIFQGNFTIGNFKELMPFNDYIIVIQIKQDDLVKGIEYSNINHYNSGGYLQLDNFDILNNLSKSNTKIINLSISTLILDGIDSNPYFLKYKVKNKYDGVPIHNIITSNKGNI